MTPEDRSWLRRFNDELASVTKADLGHAKGNKLLKIKDRYAKRPEWARLARETADIMAYHRDRLVGLPVYANDPDRRMEGAFRAAAEERATRLDHMFQEPEVEGSL